MNFEAAGPLSAIIHLGGSLIHGEFHLRLWWTAQVDHFETSSNVRMIEFHHNGWEQSLVIVQMDGIEKASTLSF